MNPKHPQTVWDEIKTEYLAETMPLRALGKKYGVDYTAICKRAKRENWQAVKKCVQQEADERTRKFVVDAKVSNNERAVRMTETLLAKIEESVDVVKPKDISALKGIVASLKDLKEMGVFQMANTESADIRVEMTDADEYTD